MRDGTESLCRAIYGRDGTAKEFLGGSDAKMLFDATDLILRYREALEAIVETDDGGRWTELSIELQAIAKGGLIPAETLIPLCQSTPWVPICEDDTDYSDDDFPCGY